MHFSAVLLLMVAGVYSTFAILCTPNYCETVKCEEEHGNDSPCPENKVKTTTICDCCEQCVDPLGAGEMCVQDLTIKLPPCAKGYECIDGFCKLAES